MNVSIIIASHGDDSWEELAKTRALPSAVVQETEVLIGHDPDGNRATVRNELAERATGDYLCFLDADDELHPHYITAMHIMWAAYEDEKGPFLFTPRVSYVVKGRPRAPKFWPEVPVWSGNWMVLGTLVPTAMFLALGGWREFDAADWNEWDDWELWIRCQKAGAQPVKVKKAIYIAHQEPTSRHRNLSHEHKVRWTYEIGRMHFPEHYPLGWNGQGL
jgi:glycosyltransferase involved in cell wall biosynthesis